MTKIRWDFHAMQGVIASLTQVEDALLTVLQSLRTQANELEDATSPSRTMSYILGSLENARNKTSQKIEEIAQLKIALRRVADLFESTEQDILRSFSLHVDAMRPFAPIEPNGAPLSLEGVLFAFASSLRTPDPYRMQEPLIPGQGSIRWLPGMQFPTDISALAGIEQVGVGNIASTAQVIGGSHGLVAPEWMQKLL